MREDPGLAPVRIDVVDGLRGIAIISVVWFHLWQQGWLWVGPTLLNGQHYDGFDVFYQTGFLGVNMFFVISGFAISLPFARSYVLGKPRPSISNFYWRRFLKIVPSYWYVIVMLLAVGYYTYPNLEFAFWDVPLHATFLHNLLPGHDSAYTGVLWSLAIEVQFYVLFVFIAGLFMRSPWLYMATAMAIAALYRAFALTQPDKTFTLNQLPSYLDCFGIGVLVSLLFVSLQRNRPRLVSRAWLWTALTVAGIALWCAVIHYYYAHRFEPDGFAKSEAALDGVFAIAIGLIMIGSLFAVRLWKVLLGNPILLFFGAISYNLYLWHHPIVVAMKLNHIPPYVTTDPHNDPAWSVPYTVAATITSIAVATAITYALERPLLNFKDRDPFAALRLFRRHPGRADVQASATARAE